MGQQIVEPELYLYFSWDAAMPPDHSVRQPAGSVDFISFVRLVVRPLTVTLGRHAVDPLVLFKRALLGYRYHIRSERQLGEEAALNLVWR